MRAAVSSERRQQLPICRMCESTSRRSSVGPVLLLAQIAVLIGLGGLVVSAFDASVRRMRAMRGTKPKRESNAQHNSAMDQSNRSWPYDVYAPDGDFSYWYSLKKKVDKCNFEVA